MFSLHFHRLQYLYSKFYPAKSLKNQNVMSNNDLLTGSKIKFISCFRKSTTHTDIFPRERIYEFLQFPNIVLKFGDIAMRCQSKNTGQYSKHGSMV